MPGITLERPVFHGPAPQAMFLLEACSDELSTAIEFARMNFFNATSDDDERKWAEVLRLLREVSNETLSESN